MKTTMNKLRVSMADFVKLRKLSDRCSSLTARGTIEFDDDQWLRGVHEILGHVPPSGEYRLVVSDELIVRMSRING